MDKSRRGFLGLLAAAPVAAPAAAAALVAPARPAAAVYGLSRLEVCGARNVAYSIVADHFVVGDRGGVLMMKSPLVAPELEGWTAARLDERTLVERRYSDGSVTRQVEGPAPELELCYEDARTWRLLDDRALEPLLA